MATERPLYRHGRPGTFMARAVLPLLMPGQAAVFDLPHGQPSRREYARTVAGVAHHGFGVGGYRARVGEGGLRITRIKP